MDFPGGEVFLLSQLDNALGAPQGPGLLSLGFGSGPDFAEEVDGGVLAKLGGEVVEAALVIAEAFGGFFGREAFYMDGPEGFILSMEGMLGLEEEIGE